ncbi:MAG: cytochrome BD ubiquinol oxidase subunit I, partial [Symbiobacterium thermophilum]
ANAWQQNPVGVDLLQSNPEAMNPWTVFVNPHWPVMAVHSTIACYAATGFAVAGVYAWGMLRGRGDPLRQKALRIALAMGLIAAVTMPLTGDLSAKVVARHQPEKLAAMEALFVTQARAPLLIGGLPNPEEGTVCCAVAVPGLLSFLAYGRLDAEVAGLDRVPRQEWPNVPLVHISFQLMVGAGIAMVLVGLYYAWVRWRRPEQVPRDRRLLWLLVLSSPLGYLALEAGWIVSETGRQPWTIWKVMLTADAVTPSGSTMALSMAGFTALYAALAAALVLLLNRLRHE